MASLISVVIPVFNEEKGLDLLVGRLPRGGEALGPSGPLDFEVVEPRGFAGGSWRVLALATYGF